MTDGFECVCKYDTLVLSGMLRSWEGNERLTRFPNRTWNTGPYFFANSPATLA